MSDRELLELAAKAACMDGWRYSGGAGMSKMLDPSRPETTGSIGPDWNPLTDDGDALRLAIDAEVRFGLVLEDARGYAEVGAVYIGFDWDPHRPSDVYAATRRAIVLCAAEIGRAAKAASHNTNGGKDA